MSTPRKEEEEEAERVENKIGHNSNSRQQKAKPRRGSRLRLKQKLEKDAEANQLVDMLFGAVKKQLIGDSSSAPKQDKSKSLGRTYEDALTDALQLGSSSEEEEDARLFGDLRCDVFAQEDQRVTLNQSASLWGHVTAPPTQNPASTQELKQSSSKANLQRPGSASRGPAMRPASATTRERKQTSRELEMQDRLNETLDEHFVASTNAMIDNLILEDYDFEETSSDPDFGNDMPSRRESKQQVEQEWIAKQRAQPPRIVLDRSRNLRQPAHHRSTSSSSSSSISISTAPVRSSSFRPLAVRPPSIRVEHPRAAPSENESFFPPVSPSSPSQRKPSRFRMPRK